MNKVQSNKLVFIETQDFIETSLALQNYHKASVAMDDIMVAMHAHDHRHAVMVGELSCYQWPEAKYLKELISVCLVMSSVVSVSSACDHGCYCGNTIMTKWITYSVSSTVLVH